MDQPTISVEKTRTGEQIPEPTPEKPLAPEANQSQILQPEGSEQEVAVPPELISGQPAPAPTDDQTDTDQAAVPETEQEAQEGPVTETKTWERVFQFFKKHLKSLLKK